MSQATPSGEGDEPRYLHGFGNEFESEALPGALPRGRNNPQTCPYGLYAEQLSGTAFTAPRGQNLRTWLYRIRPSVVHGAFKELEEASCRLGGSPEDAVLTPNQLRWSPFALPEAPTHFAAGLRRVCGAGRWPPHPAAKTRLSRHPPRYPAAAAARKTTAPVRQPSATHGSQPPKALPRPTSRQLPSQVVEGGGGACACACSPELKDGYAIHVYAATASMGDCSLCDADGDLLLVPQEGGLRLRTELGLLLLQPGEVALLPRGLRFAVDLGANSRAARGYALEAFAGHFALPELGPIGANGLASARDFQAPTAAFEAGELPHRLLHKLGGRLFEAQQRGSPFNVVAWHGNYAPFKYDLARFCPVNAVAFDHSDPSVFTVLTCPSPVPGTATADFVIFPPRWAVADGTFRPPYFHRNSMSEWMGCVRGSYDGKAGGFAPGGASLHTCMSPHGPDAATFAAASSARLAPTKLPDDSLSFMFEVNAIPRVQRWALQCRELQAGYAECWQGLGSHFAGAEQPPPASERPA